MPKLRVLVVLQPSSRTVSNQEISQKVLASFKELPSLEYIIRRDYSENGECYHYFKLRLSPNSSEDLLQEGLMIDHNIGAPWWTIYNV